MGIEGVWREDAGWQVEGIVNFSRDVARLLMALWLRRWYIFGAYLPPNNAPAVHHMEQALSAAPKRMEVILIRDLNARFPEPQNSIEEDIATDLSDYGLVDMTAHFTLRRR